ncbi:MAG: FxsB family radical SAM/SPASM domain protein, partial [Candidatus Sericytochromatia bacterium]|nr:FxsB family radical SAM/SPASM domain protein [Candidatus Tanganyikabacteria bacterium]
MIDTIVLKTAAPCNLACTYCYEYQAGDNSWKTMPKHVDVATAERLGSRICEYATGHGLKRFQVML